MPPSGLDAGLVELFSHCDDEWPECPPLKPYTNVFIWDEHEGKMLLGYKKRGFGCGLYNGFGGKVEHGELPLDAALRELQEEAVITAKLEHCGVLLFLSSELKVAPYIHIFRANSFDGFPTETDEMRPEWFAIPSEFCTGTVPVNGQSLPPIPLDKMWPDDRLWMPLLLSKQFFIGRVDFEKVDNEKEAVMKRWWFGKKLDADGCIP